METQRHRDIKTQRERKEREKGREREGKEKKGESKGEKRGVRKGERTREKDTCAHTHIQTCTQASVRTNTRKRRYRGVLWSLARSRDMHSSSFGSDVLKYPTCFPPASAHHAPKSLSALLKCSTPTLSTSFPLYPSFPFACSAVWLLTFRQSLHLRLSRHLRCWCILSFGSGVRGRHPIYMGPRGRIQRTRTRQRDLDVGTNARRTRSNGWRTHWAMSQTTADTRPGVCHGDVLSA